MLKISIPSPCHEDWDAMIPNTQGRHCNSCAKTVVDFTNMSDEEVKYFFINKKEERVCGRFKNEQLHRIIIELPQNIFHIQMPFWKQFLVASLLAFSVSLFSCDTTIKGDVVEKPAVSNDFLGKADNIKSDTSTNPVQVPQQLQCTTMGDIMPPTITGTTSIAVPIPDRELTGIIAITDTTFIQPPNKVIPDSTTIKNRPKADSVDCNKQTYY